MSRFSGRSSDIPDRFAFKSLVKADDTGWVNPGDSAIIDPDGKIIAGPCHASQELVFAEVDPDKVAGPRWQLDVAGHYGRPDVFRFEVNRAAHHHMSVGGDSD